MARVEQSGKVKVNLELEVQMIRDDGTNVGKYRIGNE